MGMWSGRADAQMLLPGGPGTFEPFTLRSIWIPSVNGSPSLTDIEARGAIPISRTEVNTWTAGLFAASMQLGSNLQLSPTGPRIPRDLWSLDANLNYAHRLAAGRTLGFTVGVGTLSDKPFHSLNETGLNASATYLTPTSGGNAWLFGLNFSNSRPALNYVPLPIVAYFWRAPEQGLDGAVGFPFAQLRWRPAPAWQLLFAAIIPAKITTELSLRPAEAIRISTGFYWDQQFWALAGRADTSRRLFYDAKTVSTGVEFSLARSLAVQATGGYAFDRSFFEGTSVFNRGDRAELNASWFAGVTLKVSPEVPRATP